MIPVLCYHRIGGPPELGVTRVSAGVFAKQMETLARAGWRALSLAEFGDRLSPGQSAIHNPQSEFLLSFDDGYASLADHAYPVLADLGFTATTFLVTDFVGGENSWDARYTWRRLRHLDWITVERWHARGFSFQSHSARHPRLTWLPDGAAISELERSRGVLVQRLGAGAGSAIAYPFGAHDARVRRFAREAGYEMGFGGVMGNARDPMSLPRAIVYRWDRLGVPAVLQDGWLGTLGRTAAHVANRCSVGTSWMMQERGAVRAAHGARSTEQKPGGGEGA